MNTKRYNEIKALVYRMSGGAIDVGYDPSDEVCELITLCQKALPECLDEIVRLKSKLQKVGDKDE